MSSQLKALLQQKCRFVVDESEAVTPAARGLKTGSGPVRSVPLFPLDWNLIEYGL